jgi:hypothetical protein
MKLVTKKGYQDQEYEDYQTHLIPGDCLAHLAEEVRELRDEVAGLTELMKKWTEPNQTIETGT